MSFDATTVSRFFSRDKRCHENDGDAVQHPVGFDLCRHLSAVGFGHYQIEKNEIGVEAPRRFQCAARVIFLTHDVTVSVLQKFTHMAREGGVVIYDENPGVTVT